MHAVEEVALLALMYYEHCKAHHSGPEGLLDDFECSPGEVNLATMIGSETLGELDWLLIEAMNEGGDLNPLASCLDSTRAEALLHAWPSEVAPPDEVWAMRFRGDGWDAVETAMQALRDEGLTARRDEVEAMAVAAYTALTGNTHEDYLDHYGWAAR
jgi:hypothetical protein